MWEALSGLTVRGRAFLAAGITAIACAIVLGQPSLTRIGVLVAVLPLLAALLIGRSRYRLALLRTVSPQVVAAGQPARVTLELTNEGRTPSGVLLLEDQVPYVLGARPRFVLEGIGHGWRRHAEYLVRSDVRGRFEIGPMTIRVADPFGLVELGRAFRSTVPLVVTPRTVDLTPIQVGGAWTGSGDNRPRAFATGSAEDVTVREYRRGDDLRRVHWRSSARVGELMVRREEQPWQSRVTLFLDNRRSAHRGQSIASSFETAVSTAASIAVHLSQRGYTVRLVTATGEEHGSAWHARDSELNTGSLLESLAVVETVEVAHPDTAWMGAGGQSGLIVGVFGALQAGDGAFVQRLGQHAGSSLAIALDVDGWVGASTGSAEPVLARSGWRAATLQSGERIGTAWQALGTGRRGRHSTGAMPTPASAPGSTDPATSTLTVGEAP